MPLYSYIPYLDPDIDEKEKRSFSGHIIDTDDELEASIAKNYTPKATSIKTPVESFKRKVNDNLKNFNSRMTDLLQDGLGGVDNICKQVKGFMCENTRPVQSENYTEKCARGDIYECREEKKNNSPATDPSQDAIYFMNHETEARLHEFQQNSVFTTQKQQDSVDTKDDNLSAFKKSKPRSRPTSKGLRPKKSEPKCSTPRLASKSFNAAFKTTETRRSSEKIKPSKAKTKKKALEAESRSIAEEIVRPKPTGEARLGQIERDYQKVVENLDMVERMMACINERMTNQKSKEEPTSQETVSTEEKSIDLPENKKKSPKLTKTKKESTGDVAQNETENECLEDRKRSSEIKVEKKKDAKEITRRKKVEIKEPSQHKDSKEKHSTKEIVEKLVAQELMNVIDKDQSQSKQLEETLKKAEQLRALNPLSRIKINDSLSDIDALIDNAVNELGNLAPTDFDISQSSSDMSFKLTTEDGAQTFYDECNLVTSSNTDSGSENDLLGEESEKFEISRSFQELKDSYVQKIKQEATGKKKPKKSKEKNRGAQKKNSFEQLHEEIFNDSSWNRLDPVSLECTFLKDPTRNSNSSIDSCDKEKEEARTTNLGTSRKDQEFSGGEEPNYAVMEALLHTKMEMMNNVEETEDVITITLPSDKETKSSSKKSKDFVPNIQNIDTEQLDDETLQITVTLNANGEDDKISESELGECQENFEANRRQERTLRKQQKKKIKDKKAARTPTKEKVKTPKSSTKEVGQIGEEGDNITTVDVNKKDSAEDTPGDTSKSKSKPVKPKLKKKSKKPVQSSIDTVEVDLKDFMEIKKMESNFSVCSGYSSTSSFGEGMFWTEDSRKKEEIKPIDPMKQVSIQCKKLIGDLVVEEYLSIEKMMDGYFNAPLIGSLVGRPKRPRSVRIHTPIQDPDLRSIAPEVHRKKAISDLHERMEYQIRQTDSFDGFLNLMNKNRRKALIKQAERQDHNLRCHMKTCFKKRYPFRVVTASVPAGYDKSREKKDTDKKYINSLWFSPKDFKLRRNSRIFNRKRMEMYCQSLHKGPMIPRCKCTEVTSGEGKKNEKASNYSILVRSGTPLGRRPNTPRRWIQLRPPTVSGGRPTRPRLHHCDILDDLTLKDLAPFNAEYPRNDERHISGSLQRSLLYKLACGGHKGDADGALMELVAPKLSCTQNDCKICKTKLKSDKKPGKKVRSAKKSGDEASVTSTKTNELQNLTAKAATQLLMQNIGEIKSKKSSTKSQSSDKNLNKRKETKSKRSVKSLGKNTRKIPAQDSKSALHQRLEENLVKKIFYSQHIPLTDFTPKSVPLQKMAFKGVDQFQRALKVPELYPKPSGRKSNINKLFPYINDPDNKVFQNITVLPVEVFYDFEPLKDSSEKTKELQELPPTERPPTKGSSPINVTSLSETDELEVSNVERPRPSTAGDRNMKKKITGRRRLGTPKSPIYGSRQSSNKFASLPPNVAGCNNPIDVMLTRRSREIILPSHETNTPKISPRRHRFKRSSSLGKSTESDNTVSQCVNRKPGNPNPWKPASRRPRTPKTPPLPKSPMRIRSKERNSLQQKPSKTISTGRISPRQNAKMQHKTYSPDSCRVSPETKDHTQKQVLVNKEKRLRFELNPNKNFYDIDMGEVKTNPRAPIHRCHPLSPSQKVMVDHLHSLRNRNTKLQGNIQKAINIIEEKMVDVLSTNDQNYKKRTIDKMEKEINKVLKMINEQNSNTVKKEDEVEALEMQVQKSILKKNDADKKQEVPEEPRCTNEKALIDHTIGLKMPRPPRKRSISRVLKFSSRPSTVEEERSFDLTGSELFRINEGVASAERDGNEMQDEPKVEQEEPEEKTQRVELYPSPVANEEGEAPLCPVLRCPTPKTSIADLSKKTKKALRKMSKEAFGKFADVVKTKTRLIIDMTEQIDMDDANLLPSPKITSAIPAILARSKLPVITTIHQPRAADLMSTTVSSIVSVHQAPIDHLLNASAEALSGATTEISEFANGCAERSITSFSGSESYTWRKIEQSQLECSSCSLKRKFSHDLTPFMRALNNLKAGRLFEKRHHLLPIEETSPNFRKLMGFLEGLSKVKETFNQTTMGDVQLMWNPEKRCSFHNSIAGSRKLRFRKNSRAISEHSLVPSHTSSFSDNMCRVRIEEKPSETNISMGASTKEPQGQENVDKSTRVEEDKESGVQTEKRQDLKEVKLVFSEVHLVSISNTKTLIKKKKNTNLHLEEPLMMVKDNRYSTFLKFFYLVFYTLVYFCMTAMNFSC